MRKRVTAEPEHEIETLDFTVTPPHDPYIVAAAFSPGSENYNWRVSMLDRVILFIRVWFEEHNLVFAHLEPNGVPNTALACVRYKNRLGVYVPGGELSVLEYAEWVADVFEERSYSDLYPLLLATATELRTATAQLRALA